jgi:hypothetical protein
MGDGRPLLKVKVIPYNTLSSKPLGPKNKYSS